MSELLKISLPDGSVREMPAGSTPADVAAAIGPGLAKAALAARVDGEVRDLTRPFDGDAQLALITGRDEADALELMRHDYAHVLAEAVQELWPDTQITFGPSTDDGFYYDFAPGARGPFTDEDLPLIEAQMRAIIAADKPLRRELVIGGEVYTLTHDPERLKLVPKGKRKGLELLWTDLVSGDAALAKALQASLQR